MTEVIDAARAVELLEKAVAERGEQYVYAKVFDASAPEWSVPHGYVCVYVDPADGQPSCMVGLALSLAGVTTEELLNVNDTSAASLPGERLSVEVSPAAATVFENAQQMQDMGATWGNALAAARRTAVSS